MAFSTKVLKMSKRCDKGSTKDNKVHHTFLQNAAFMLLQHCGCWVLVTNVGHQEFDQTMSYIKTLTYIRPAYVLNMSLSNLRPAFGLEIKGLSSSDQGFVLLVAQMSSFCPLNRLKFTEKLHNIF